MSLLTKYKRRMNLFYQLQVNLICKQGTKCFLREQTHSNHIKVISLTKQIKNLENKIENKIKNKFNLNQYSQKIMKITKNNSQPNFKFIKMTYLEKIRLKTMSKFNLILIKYMKHKMKNSKFPINYHSIKPSKAFKFNHNNNKRVTIKLLTKI